MNSIVKQDAPDSGCTLNGQLVVGKVGGNFHISTGQMSLPAVPMLQLGGGLLSTTVLPILPARSMACCIARSSARSSHLPSGARGA